MARFSLTLLFGGPKGQKSYWKGVIKELEKNGANLIEVESNPAKLDVSLRPINVVTISYGAGREIKIGYPLLRI